MVHDDLALRGMRPLELRRLDLLRPAVPILQALALAGIITICLAGITSLTQLSHVSTAYLVAVLIAATRWGAVPAVAAALGGMVASAFFFYPPLYDLRVSDPQHLMDLALFVSVAMVTGHLADSARAHMRAAQRREEEVRSLYAFSRRLAVASTVEEILASARDHLSAVLGHPVLLLQARSADGGPSAGAVDTLPHAVRASIARIEAGVLQERAFCVDDATRSTWLVGPVSLPNPGLGIVAVNLGPFLGDDLRRLRPKLDAALADAGATLERLDVARALGEARARSIRETFREALIGSVSHELRTPLAAILGAASVLARAPAVAEDDRLAQLAEIVRGEADRLDSDIQKLLDASRISSDGLRPQSVWTDPADLVDAALEPRGRRPEDRRIEVNLPEELPLVYVDPMLVTQALRQIVDNAAKYSPAGSTIRIGAREAGEHVVVDVRDEGMGVTDEEKERLFERFYRSPRHSAAQPGSGLGLWIAQAFVRAIGGQLTIDSGGRDRGTTVTVRLPAPRLG